MDEKPKDRKDNRPKDKKEPRAKPKETPEAPAPAADAVAARNEALLEEDEKDAFAPLTPRQSYQPTSRRQSRASPRNSLAPAEKVKCYFCGKEGHMARDCPNTGITLSMTAIDAISAHPEMPVISSTPELPAISATPERPAIPADEAPIATQRRRVRTERRVNDAWDHALYEAGRGARNEVFARGPQERLRMPGSKPAADQARRRGGERRHPAPAAAVPAAVPAAAPVEKGLPRRPARTPAVPAVPAAAVPEEKTQPKLVPQRVNGARVARFPRPLQPEQPTRQPRRRTQAPRPAQPTQAVQPVQPIQPMQPMQTVQPVQPVQPAQTMAGGEMREMFVPTRGHSSFRNPNAPVFEPRGMMPQGMMPPGVMPQDMMQQGMVPQGSMQQGMMPQGMMQQGMMPQSMMQQGMMQQGTMPQSMMQQGMMQQGMMVYGDYGQQGMMPYPQMQEMPYQQMPMVRAVDGCEA